MSRDGPAGIQPESPIVDLLRLAAREMNVVEYDRCHRHLRPHRHAGAGRRGRPSFSTPSSQDGAQPGRGRQPRDRAPWHLAAVLEGVRLRMDPSLRIIDRSAIFAIARHALELHRGLIAPDFDQEGEVQRGEAHLARSAGQEDTPLLAAARPPGSTKVAPSCCFALSWCASGPAITCSECRCR